MSQESAGFTSSDDLLAHFIGEWHITRTFKTRTAQNKALVEFVLGGHWLRLSMWDIEEPRAYEADVYITRMVDSREYSIHWLDSFGGTLPESLGVGKRSGNAIVFDWKDSDGELRNTFTWHPETGSWTSHIEQTSASGEWAVFCTDTYHRLMPA